MKYFTLSFIVSLGLLAFSCKEPQKNLKTDELVIISDSGIVSQPADTTYPADTVDTATPTDTMQYIISLSYPGASSVGWDAVYIAWIEDSLGNNLQNLYICNSIIDDMTGNTGRLTGCALPYWRREKSSTTDLTNVDAVSGASVQGPAKIIRNLTIGDVSVFRVCFEIDRSLNGNDYFTDRPTQIYRTDLIDLDDLAGSYELALHGFMANDTQDEKFGQNPPLKEIPGFEVWKYMTDLQYIAPRDILQDESDEHSNLIVNVQLKK